MSTIIIENAPKNYTMNYSDCIIIKKSKLTDWLKQIIESNYDSKNETYWPFEWEEAINFLKLLDYEDKLS